MRSQLFLFFMVLVFSALFSSAVLATEQYKVIKVESWDTLNMRSGPGTKNDVIGKLPHNANNVVLLGDNKKVGRTQWVEISWKGKRGWVSKAYLGKQAAGATPAPAAQSDKDKAVELIDKSVSAQPEKKPPPPQATVIKNKQSGMWILECGNASPYWRVEVLPEWMRGTLGKHQTGMPITHKRQKHGKYRNVAIETEVRGSNKWNRLRMTLTYNKSCYSNLTKRKVAFSVEGMFNNEPISGCCRSYQVK